jgi:hypothetical protein
MTELTEIYISNHQATLLIAATAPGNTEHTVWSVKNTRRATFLSLYSSGLINKPDYGAHLTDEGRRVALHLRQNPLLRSFAVPVSALPTGT